MVVGLVPTMINPKCSGGSWGCTECYGLCQDVGFLPQQVNNRHCPKEAFGEEGSHCSWSYPISVTPKALGRRWMEHAGYVGEHQDMSGDDSTRWFDWLYMAPIIEMHKARNTTKRHTCPPMIWLYKVQCTVPDLFKLYLPTDLYVYNFTCVHHGK